MNIKIYTKLVLTIRLSGNEKSRRFFSTGKNKYMFIYPVPHEYCI